MIEITRKDIIEMKTFTKYGDVFTQIRNNPETGWWLYERPTHYEVVKGKPKTNPNGEKVLIYPSESDWGKYGYTVPKCWWADKVIDFIMSRKVISPQELYEFKTTLKHPSNLETIKEIREF